MTGNDVCLVLTEKDRRLFEALAMLRVVDRDQAKDIMGRAGVSNSTVNMRLKKLTDARLLNRFFVGTNAGGIKALYVLSPKSAALVGPSAKPLKRRRDCLSVSDQFVHHQLAVNEVLIPLKFNSLPTADVQLERLRTFSQVLSQTVLLIPDGYVEFASPTGTYSMFCEVDRGTESQKIWSRKVQLYLQLAVSGEFERLFSQQRFRVLVIAETERRLKQICRTVAKQTDKLFWFSTLTTIRREGLFASHWLRPVGEGRHSLL